MIMYWFIGKRLLFWVNNLYYYLFSTSNIFGVIYLVIKNVYKLILIYLY